MMVSLEKGREWAEVWEDAQETSGRNLHWARYCWATPASVCMSGGGGDSPNDKLKSESRGHRGEEHIWRRTKF